MGKYQPTEAELQAAFLAARTFGKILDDEVLSAILIAAHDNVPQSAKEIMQSTRRVR